MSLRTRVRYHSQRRFKMHRLTILKLTVCRWRGHRWDRIATDMLGVCGRCYRDWDDRWVGRTYPLDDVVRELGIEEGE